MLTGRYKYYIYAAAILALVALIQVAIFPEEEYLSTVHPDYRYLAVLLIAATLWFYMAAGSAVIGALIYALGQKARLRKGIEDDVSKTILWTSAVIAVFLIVGSFMPG